MKSEKRALVGFWREAGGEGFVSVSIYVVDTLKEAEQWWALHGKGHKDWTIKPYPVGDGGWRAEHATGQIQIHLRRGLYVIAVSSKDAGVVERVARQVALYFDATQAAAAADERRACV